MKQYLGIDYGTKRMGLAVASDDSGRARALTTIEPAHLPEIISEYGPFELIVLGLPRSLDGDDTRQTAEVRKFAGELSESSGLEVILIDEAGTSSVATDRLRQRNKKFAKSDIDAEAASIILQDYLDQL